MARTALGAPLSTETLRGLLMAEHLGTPSLDPPNDRIGVMPDLQVLLSHDVGASLAGADLPGAGEYVFVVLVGHGGDPLPALPDFTAGGLVDAGVAIEHFLQNVNNATRRSVSVVNPVLPVDALWTVDLPFTLEPVPGEEVEVHLDVLPGGGLPAATKLRMRTTEGSRLRHARERPAWEKDSDGGWTRAAVAPRRSTSAWSWAVAPPAPTVHARRRA